MARTKDMTIGDPLRLILFFSLPIIAGNLLQQLYSLVDTLVIGRVEGVTQLTAVSSAGWLDWTVLGVAMGIAQGFAIQIAQSFGAKDVPGLRRAEGQSIVLAVLCTLVLEVVSQALLAPVLALMETPLEFRALTQTYLRIIFGGLPLVMGYNLLSGFLRSVGDSRTPLISIVCAAGMNIILDLLFVAQLRWGVVGVAAATVLAQGFSMLICLVAVCRLPVMHLSRRDLLPDRAMSARLMKLGMPIAFQNAIISVGGLVLQGVVNRQGFLFTAGYSAASRMQGLVEVAGVSVSTAVGTFAGQNLGAGRIDRVKHGLRCSVWVSVALAMAVGAVMIAFGRPLLSLFVEDDPDIVEKVLDIGCQFLTVMSVGLFTLYLLFVYRATLQGLGDTVIPMISGFVELAMRIGSILLLPLVLGVWGIYLAEIMAWAGAAALLMWGYYYRVRRLSAGNGPAPGE